MKKHKKDWFVAILFFFATIILGFFWGLPVAVLAPNMWSFTKEFEDIRKHGKKYIKTAIMDIMIRFTGTIAGVIALYIFKALQ